MKAALIIAAFVVAAGLVVVAIGMPCIFGCQHASKERNASATLKTIAVAQADFRANDRDQNRVQDFWRGDIAGLYTIRPKGAPDAIKLIEISVVGADDRPASDITPYAVRAPKAGYWFRAVLHEGEKAPGPDRFAAMAYPAEYGKESRNLYIVSEDGQVHKTDFRQKGSISVYPAGPAAQGWSKLD